MNYFAHALPFLDDPYFAAGTGVPDWLTLADRKVRVRKKHAEALLGDSDSVTAAVAGGVIQHLRDDARFHESSAFAQLSVELTAAVRDVLGEPFGLRPNFLGHLLVEILLDACLIAEDTARLEDYYRAIESIDARLVQQAVNRMMPHPTARLAMMISRFSQERILWDYLEDARLLVRLSQVMRRVGFVLLPEGFRHFLPEARRRVDCRKAELLEGIPTKRFAWYP